MGARQRMTMRAYIERNDASANVYGHKSVPDWQSLSTTPCRVWSTRGDARHTPQVDMDAERFEGIMPIDTDVTSDDRLLKVTDREGSQLYGKMVIDSIAPANGRSHLQLALRRQE